MLIIIGTRRQPPQESSKSPQPSSAAGNRTKSWSFWKSARSAGLIVAGCKACESSEFWLLGLFGLLRCAAQGLCEFGLGLKVGGFGAWLGVQGLSLWGRIFIVLLVVLSHSSRFQQPRTRDPNSPKSPRKDRDDSATRTQCPYASSSMSSRLLAWSILQ